MLGAHWFQKPALRTSVLNTLPACLVALACAGNEIERDPRSPSGGGSESGRAGGPSGSGASGSGTAGASAPGGSGASTGGVGNAGSDTGGVPGGSAGDAVGGIGGLYAGGTSSGGAAGSGGATVPAVPLDPALMSSCSGSRPIKCTLKVPSNGNYNVTVELGSAQAASVSQVEAELYRIVVPTMKLAAGSYAQQTFSVNVRAEVHDDYSAPGKELNVLIDGDAPALHGLGYAAASMPTLFVVGDSTVCDWDPAHAGLGPTERGWAQELSQYLKPGLAVANYADSGDTAGSLYTKFASRGAVLKEGDYLFIQFGHNDMKAQADVASYKANLMKFITDARAAKATPILFSPAARRAYLDDHNKPTTLQDPGFNGLDQQARELAAAEHVAFVDLTTLAINYYGTVDPTLLFTSKAEIAHFNITGASAIAKLVADALKAGTAPASAVRDFLD
jgi:lysophospholipase L1-like esterase